MAIFPTNFDVLMRAANHNVYTVRRVLSKIEDIKYLIYDMAYVRNNKRFVSLDAAIDNDIYTKIKNSITDYNIIAFINIIDDIIHEITEEPDKTSGSIRPSEIRKMSNPKSVDLLLDYLFKDGTEDLNKNAVFTVTVQELGKYEIQFNDKSSADEFASKFVRNGTVEMTDRQQNFTKLLYTIGE